MSATNRCFFLSPELDRLRLGRHIGAEMYYLLGGSGVPNYGDELIAKYWLTYLAEKNPTERIVLECTDPSISALRLHPYNWRASHVTIVKSLTRSLPNDDFWGNLERGYKFFYRNTLAKHPRLTGVEKYFQDAHTFHMIGGGYISEKWPRTSFLLGFAAALNKTFGTRIIATGVGLMPMSPPPTEHKRTFRKVIESFDFIESRDGHGPQFIAEHSGIGKVAYHGLDDTFMRSEPTPSHGGRTLHISTYLQNDRLAALVRRVKRHDSEIKRQFDRILFWNCAPDRDQLAQEAFKEAFPNMEVADVWSLVDRLPVKAGDTIISSRFHPHLLAARAGANGYYLEHGEYYQIKHGSVVELGSPLRPIVELEEVGFTPVDAPAPIVSQDAERVKKKLEVARLIYEGRRPSRSMWRTRIASLLSI